MTLFFDYKVAAQNKAEPVCIAWHSQLHLLAVATKDSSVSVYSEEGEHIEEITIKRTDKIPCIISWHKQRTDLFVGWNDGK